MFRNCFAMPLVSFNIYMFLKLNNAKETGKSHSSFIVLLKVSTGYIVGEEQEVTNVILWFFCLWEEFKVKAKCFHRTLQ